MRDSRQPHFVVKGGVDLRLGGVVGRFELLRRLTRWNIRRLGLTLINLSVSKGRRS